MNYLDKRFERSVLNTEFYPVLLQLREIMTSIKDEKLEKHHAKLIKSGRIHEESSVREGLDYLVSEVTELRESLEQQDDGSVVLREVADVINCAEIIGAVIIRNSGMAKS
jgi:hypothetical protein